MPMFVRKLKLLIAVYLFFLALFLAITNTPQAKANAFEEPKPARHTIAANFISSKYKVDLETAKVIVASVYENCSELGLDPNYVFGIISVESKFKKDGKYKGSIGLMQIIPRYHQSLIAEAKKVFGVSRIDLFDPEVNIWIGSRISKQYLELHNGRIDLALLQYNGSLRDKHKTYYKKVFTSKQIFDKEFL